MSCVAANRFESELVERAELFLEAARSRAESRALLERFGYTPGEHDRGIGLVAEARRALAWSAAGTAWNFLSDTRESREAEAHAWYAEARRRHVQRCVRRAESRWSAPPAPGGPPRVRGAAALAALRDLLHAGSVRVWRAHRAELERDLVLARGERPARAPLPKDAALVELGGWYERWRLLAQRVFRERPDLLAPYGLTPGRAPPRLRGKEAARYGEKAAPRLPLVS